MPTPSARRWAAIDGLTITMLGDLKYGRTVHSLAKLLTLFDVKINYVSPEILQMPELLVKEVDAAGIEQYETTDLDEVLADYRRALRHPHPEGTVRGPGRVRAGQGLVRDHAPRRCAAPRKT